MHLRRLLLEFGLLRIAFFLMTVTAILMVSDWYFRFSPGMCLVSLVSVLGVGGLCYWYDLQRPLRGSWSDEEVLTYLDRSGGGGLDGLTTLKDLSNTEGMHEVDTDIGKSIVDDVVKDLGEKANKYKIGSAFSGSSLMRWRMFAGVLALLYVGALMTPRDDAGKPYLLIGLQRMFMPWSPVYWPQDTRIMVRESEGGWRIPTGEPFTVEAYIDGVVPTIVSIVYKNESGSLWITERMAVNPVDSTATFSFGEVVEPFDFYCLGGDDYEKRTYSISVAERPILTEIKATYTFPPYTRLPRKISASGQLAGLEGADVLLEFTASNDLNAAKVTFNLEGKEPEVTEVKEISGDTFKVKHRLSRSGTYTIDLTNTENLKNGRPERYEIRVEPDQPPEIILKEPMSDLMMTARGKLRVKFKAEDDYNLTELVVNLAPEGSEGVALSNRITGPFWSNKSTLHPVGEGEFEIDLLKEKDKEPFKGWNIGEGIELDLWVRAVDCNPVEAAVTESSHIRLSVLNPTDFMEAVLLTAKDLLNDARVGWFASAGVYHDGSKWVKQAKEGEDMDAVVNGVETAARSSLALSIRFPELMKHMELNRMQKEFMYKRLERIGMQINRLKKLTPQMSKAVSEGKPSSREEDTAKGRASKMSGKIKEVLKQTNSVAWQYKILYDRLANWVALQSVLMKTRRIEELQTSINKNTQELVKKILGKEARELDDDEVREMKSVGNTQLTVQEMEESIEKELAELILQADRDGRRKIWEYLAKAFHDLRKERLGEKLKRVAAAILDARGDVVSQDQKLVLDTVRTVNRGLIKAGEEVTDDPPASLLASPIPDPRGQAGADKKIDAGGEEVADDAYEKLEKLEILEEVSVESLAGTLDKILKAQEDVRNRTRNIYDKGHYSKRYKMLRTGLTSLRQDKVVHLLKKAVGQVELYGQAEQGKESDFKPDPALGATKTRIKLKLTEYLKDSEAVVGLLNESQFGKVSTGLQGHIQEGAHDIRVFIQSIESLHSLHEDRKAKNYIDTFDRRYFLRENNLAVMVGAARELEWARVQTASSGRLASVLDEHERDKSKNSDFSEKISEQAIQGVKDSLLAVKKLHSIVSEKVKDPEEEEKSNERVKPNLNSKVLVPLPIASFESPLGAFDKKSYSTLPLSQDGLRRSLSSALVVLGDLFEARVPPKAAVDYITESEGAEGVVVGPGGMIDYKDERPGILADRIESEASWIDTRLGGPEVRKKLVSNLRKMDKFDGRYARLQSAYFQAIAQEFQSKAKKSGGDKK